MGETLRVQAPADAEQGLIEKAQEARGEAPEEKPEESSDESTQEEGDEAGESEESAEGDESSDDDDGKGDESSDEPEYALDFGELWSQVEEHGGLSEENIAKVESVLEEAKIPKEVLPVYLMGLRAINQLRINSAHQAAGGSEQYDAMVGWAKENLNDGEIAAFNTAIQTSDEAAALAVSGLSARYAAAGGQRVQSSQEPDLRARGARVPAPARGNAIMSRAELSTITADPRYRNDPAYREDVQARLRAGMESGNYRAN